MCMTCGCSGEDHHHDHGHHRHEYLHGSSGQKIAVETDILAKNDRLAAENRSLFRKRGVFALNLVSSPGSGKTTLLERTLADLSGEMGLAVIEGDQQTDRDAVRIAATGASVVQINTGTGCHLDAHMVGHAAEQLDLSGIDILFVENVGNLVCPATFDLGEHHKVVVLSVTEGEDKPLKYPGIFHAADIMLLNKIDLLPHLGFDVAQCREMAQRVNPAMTIFEVSARTGQGMDAWYCWLTERLSAAS
ncbi:hydrogenase nickel incorporation protein HypB [Geotalea sp. SG265]|uniref:hydrogenase nickel incorporation protein HypB n=1 Tax=Geotalea sp. SG265 TaxID=2922867 RepID=UPI001FAF24F7|nr:hydrogenase nickel incorporation protein HypB [Geotalea sp. SG265]